jgi:hypothetical protein
MMVMQPQRENRPCLAIKGIFICISSLSFFSCSSTKISHDTYIITNSVIGIYANKDSVYLYPKIVSLDTTLLDSFTKNGIDINGCDSILVKITSSRKEKTRKNEGEEKWDYSRITNPKVITRLELKLPSSIERYKKLTIPNKWDLLDRKFMLWRFEHNQGMVHLSYPLFNKEKTHALVYVSKYHDGEFVIVLKKEAKNRWEVACEKRLSHY